MAKRAIKHPEYFEVSGTETDKACLGCDQEWYGSEWQRISGCGPTAASNIVYYLGRTRYQTCRLDVQNGKEGCLALMEKVWNYVTPDEEGVDSTTKFRDSLRAFFDSAGVVTFNEVCDIPEERGARPTPSDVLELLFRAFDNDAPAAFLNLCNGEVDELEAWHWVTAVSVEYSNDAESISLGILDEGRIKYIDLVSWLKTTSLGGGFVYFSIQE
jgi:hypothetical protein